MNKNIKRICTAIVCMTLVSGALSSAPGQLSFAADDILIHDDFESSGGSWEARGGCSASLKSSNAFSGDKAYFVTGRTAEWNGITKSLGSDFKAGNEYSFSAAMMSSKSCEFKMTLQYKDGSGTTAYDKIASVENTPDEYIQIANTNYTIPSDATDLQIILETIDGTMDFYADEFTAAKAGTEIKMTSKPSRGDVNLDGEINIADLCLMMSGALDETSLSDSTASKQADVNQSGLINYKDVSMLTDYLFGKIEKFEKSDVWEGPVKETSDPKEFMNEWKSKFVEYCPAGITDKKNGVTYGTVKKYQYFSTTRGRNTNVNVLFPPNYDESKEYPVLYAMHGYYEDEDSLVNMSKAQNMYGNLMASGDVEEMIIVFPYIFTSKTLEKVTGMDDTNSAAYDNFINDLFTDLMPYIEKTFPVKTGRDNTAICGFSMGGKEALIIGLSRSDAFGYVDGICPAPGMIPGNLSQDKVKPAYDMPYMLMVTAGGNDTVVFNSPASYEEALTKNGIDHIFFQVGQGGHGDSSVQPSFYNFLRCLFKA